jgi:hypothetical protein
MTRALHAAALLLCMAGAFWDSAHATEFSPQQIYRGTALELHGRAEAHYLFWHVYDAALYLPTATPIGEVLARGTAKCLDIAYQRSISASDLRRSASEVLKRQLPAETLRRLQPDIERLGAAYRDVSRGDRYRLCYAPGYGTTLFRNGEPQIDVRGAAFAAAYFGIWLSAEGPLSATVRQRLLAEH